MKYKAWHWFSAKRTPQAPPLFIGNLGNNHNRQVIGYYGLELSSSFFGVLRFAPPKKSEPLDTRGDLTDLDLVKLHRKEYNSGLKEALVAVRAGWRPKQYE
jgi:hypothetical protein